MCEIYGLYVDDPSDIRYIGKAVNGAIKRFREHRWNADNGSRLPVHCWMRKHGIQNVKFRVLCLASRDDLADAERWWIAQLKPDGRLLNLTEGGDGHGNPNPCSPDRRRKISEGLTEHWSQPEAEARRREMSERFSGVPIPADRREKIRASMKGNPKVGRKKGVPHPPGCRHCNRGSAS